MRRKDREITERAIIEEIISNSDVCRIAMADNNVPYIVSLNFGYTGGDKPCFWFHCAPEGRKQLMLEKNNYVCFELDTDHKLYPGEEACDWGMNFSSVVGYGKVYIVKELEEKIKGLRQIMLKYSGSKEFKFNEKVLERTKVLMLEVDEMTGKRK